MKFMYIAGLEHSGSTLLNEQMAQRSQVLGLGEVGNFFSPQHMEAYIDRWGNEPDARLCSCGETWEKCSFWRDVMDLCGERSNNSHVEKYARLFKYIRRQFPKIRVVVDSTKSRHILDMLIDNSDQLGIGGDAIQIILVVKDVRSFALSIRRKTGQHSLVRAIRTMNWWYGETSTFLTYGRRIGSSLKIVSYEKFCDDPDHVINAVLEENLLCNEEVENDVHSEGSHIVMGNKDYLMRNRRRIRYDTRWFMDDYVNLAYMLHSRARRLNHRLYREAV